MKTCPKCKTSVKGEWIKCPLCQTPLVTEAETEQKPSSLLNVPLTFNRQKAMQVFLEFLYSLFYSTLLAIISGHFNFSVWNMFYLGF